MDLFTLTRDETSELTQSTIASLIKSNRDLKTQYNQVRDRLD